MSSTMMMERTTMGLPGAGVSVPGMPSYTAPSVPSPYTNYLMVPRCTFQVEKCTGGLKLTCSCEDKTACSMVQNLCAMLAGGMCSCCVTCNGMTVCTYNFTLGLCKCEPTTDGVCVTCVSGDAKCCEMLQSFCDCLSCCLESGCTCCFFMGGTPVCCGGSETSKTPVKTKK